uniref:Uncharacterized protein n=1 Tax=Rhizophora mucronata TaxID=61149 RepID=A0A2P2N8Z8_RHIMU
MSLCFCKRQPCSAFFCSFHNLQYSGPVITYRVLQLLPVCNSLISLRVP